MASYLASFAADHAFTKFTADYVLENVSLTLSKVFTSAAKFCPGAIGDTMACACLTGVEYFDRDCACKTTSVLEIFAAAITGWVTPRSLTLHQDLQLLDG